MNKLKMLVAAALVAATVGFGALAAAPSASAQRLVPEYVCKALVQAADRYTMLANSNRGWPLIYWYYVNKAADYWDSYINAGC